MVEMNWYPLRLTAPVRRDTLGGTLIQQHMVKNCKNRIAGKVFYKIII